MTSEAIISSFDRKEKFSHKNVPKHFNSVSDAGLRYLKTECSEKLNKKFPAGVVPTATKSALSIIDGEFNGAYVELEGDYTARKNNLEAAYSDGLAELMTKITEFENLVSNHNIEFKQYSKALYEATGEYPDEKLAYDKSKLEVLNDKLESLKERSKNNGRK